jgi:flagellar motor protein MotB
VTGRAVGRRRPRKSGEVWQVVYMDLMTMVMVFFVILWSINQGKDVGATDSIGDQTAHMVSLPSDILFAPGKAVMTGEGKQVFARLFSDSSGQVLNFDTGGLTRRWLVVHGHTDSDGDKDSNFLLGYRRAFAAYKEIAKYGDAVPEHVVLCSHADNSPAQETPAFAGETTWAQRAALREAKAKNRRILLEDKVVSNAGEK